MRPQTTARSVGMLFSLATARPFDRAPAGATAGMRNGKKLVALRDPAMRARLIEARRRPPRRASICALFVVNSWPTGTAGPLRPRPDDVAGGPRRPAGHQPGRGLHRAAMESDGAWCCSLPFLNQQLAAVERDARRRTGHARPRRCRRARRPDPRRQPADVPPDLLDPRASALEPRGGRAPAHQRHRRPVRLHRSRPARRRAPSPM